MEWHGGWKFKRGGSGCKRTNQNNETKFLKNIFDNLTRQNYDPNIKFNNRIKILLDKNDFK